MAGLAKVIYVNTIKALHDNIYKEINYNASKNKFSAMINVEEFLTCAPTNYTGDFSCIIKEAQYIFEKLKSEGFVIQFYNDTVTITWKYSPE